jgi:hypothetical protein
MNVSVMGALQEGFGTDFGHSPAPGSRETLISDLAPVSAPNAPEGFVLNRDDVCRFFYPLPVPSTKLALDAKPEDVAMTVEFFDESEHTLVEGGIIQRNLRDMMSMYGSRPGKFKGEATFAVRTLVTKLGTADAVDTVNVNPIRFGKASSSK